MSWMEKLYKTYENVHEQHVGTGSDKVPLWPSCHITQNIQVEVILNEKAEILRARVIPKDQAMTIIPATESSAGRTSSLEPHPLFDKLQYIVSDYKTYGGTKESGFDDFMSLLNDWCNSPYAHPKVTLVRDYLQQGTLISDLLDKKILYVDSNQKFLKKWEDKQADPPEIFSVFPASSTQADIFVRFGVEIPGDPASELWLDKTVRESWSRFIKSYGNKQVGLCYVTGQESILALNHPKKIRHSGDGAKLISSNDKDGYTFRGRFEQATEACGIGLDVTQKAHSALRWLIGRQGWRGTGDNNFSVVAWTVEGDDPPYPLADTYELFRDEDACEESASTEGYTAQDFGNRLASMISGYKDRLGDTADIVVMAMDSALPGRGRMGIKYYRELTGSEFLERLKKWHTKSAWFQNFGQDKQFFGAPSPKSIAKAAYGSRLDDKLKKSTVERLLPCIVDGAPIPKDLVDSCIRRASNRIGLEKWEWEACLGVACALFNSFKGGYTMALERKRNARDYLYGRLLALADHLERSSLSTTGENRETNASRLMHRFSIKPFTTWKIINDSLTPHRVRLRANLPGVLGYLEKEFDEVFNLFESEEFISDDKLTGEYLLGFHCQRSYLWQSKKAKETMNQEETQEMHV